MKKNILAMVFITNITYSADDSMDNPELHTSVYRSAQSKKDDTSALVISKKKSGNEGQTIVKAIDHADAKQSTKEISKEVVIAITGATVTQCLWCNNKFQTDGSKICITCR